jgi:segregation and condensation protein B
MSDIEAPPIHIEVERLSAAAQVEALLFVADGPTPVMALATALGVVPDAVEAALEELATTLAARGVRLQRMADRVQLVTAPAAAQAVEQFLGLQSTVRLSTAALETLAIIAYKQPVTRPALEALRGVNCDAVLKTLLSRGLIEEMGRSEGVGRPILYGTTFSFLQQFGLASLAELPLIDFGEPAEPPAELAPEPPSITQSAELAPEVLEFPAGLAAAGTALPRFGAAAVEKIKAHRSDVRRKRFDALVRMKT